MCVVTRIELSPTVFNFEKKMLKFKWKSFKQGFENLFKYFRSFDELHYIDNRELNLCEHKSEIKFSQINIEK